MYDLGSPLDSVSGALVKLPDLPEQVTTPMLLAGAALGGYLAMRGRRKCCRKAGMALAAVSGAYIAKEHVIGELTAGWSGLPGLYLGDLGDYGVALTIQQLRRKIARLEAKHPKSKRDKRRLKRLRARLRRMTQRVRKHAARRLARGKRLTRRQRRLLQHRVAGKRIPPRFTGPLVRIVRGKRVTFWFVNGRRVSRAQYVKLTRKGSGPHTPRVVKRGPMIARANGMEPAPDMAPMPEARMMVTAQDDADAAIDDADLEADTGSRTKLIIGGAVAIAAVAAAGYAVKHRKRSRRSRAA